MARFIHLAFYAIAMLLQSELVAAEKDTLYAVELEFDKSVNTKTLNNHIYNFYSADTYKALSKQVNEPPNGLSDSFSYLKLPLTQVVEISVVHRDPEKAKLWGDAAAKLFLSKHPQTKRLEKKTDKALLLSQLKKAAAKKLGKPFDELKPAPVSTTLESLITSWDGDPNPRHEKFEIIIGLLLLSPDLQDEELELIWTDVATIAVSLNEILPVVQAMVKLRNSHKWEWPNSIIEFFMEDLELDKKPLINTHDPDDIRKRLEEQMRKILK